MAFIKVQKLVLSEDGNVISGSAAVVDIIYDSSVKGGHATGSGRSFLTTSYPQ